MTTSAVGPSPYRAAIDARDAAAVADACAPEVVFNSPITSTVRFEGREEFAELVRTVFEVYDDVRCVDEFESGDVRVVRLHARIGPQELDEVQLLRLDRHGRVREITMFARPLPALTTLTAALGPRLARRRSRLRGALLAVMTRPLAAMTRMGDRTGARLVKP